MRTADASCFARASAVAASSRRVEASAIIRCRSAAAGCVMEGCQRLAEMVLLPIPSDPRTFCGRDGLGGSGCRRERPGGIWE